MTEWIVTSSVLIAAIYAVLRSSDAHNLDDVAKVWTEVDLDDFSINGLKSIFSAKATAISPRLVNFS